jgi:hypothetical protein
VDSIPQATAIVGPRHVRAAETQIDCSCRAHRAAAAVPDHLRVGWRCDDVYLDMQWQDAEHFERGTAGRLRIRIVGDNPDALFEEFRAKGVLDQSTKVRDSDWGTGEFGFRDPDGNGLTFYRKL